MKRALSVAIATAIAAAGALLPVTAAQAVDTSEFTVSDVQASWVDSTVTVTYGWDSFVLDSSLDVQVDGISIKHTDARRYGNGTVTATTSRTITAPVSVAIVAHVCGYTEDYSGTDCQDVTKWTGTLHRLRTPPAGKSSATALLNKLPVRTESHAGSYARSKFPLWVDANKDGENTRAEILKAESKKRATTSRTGTVTAGRWTSPYDTKTVTTPSKLDIDHTVPLAEAWTSGAATWSTKKRTAYANDLGYSPSLTAVTKRANRAKGDRDPGSYLPPTQAYRCAYIRNWIAVKSRWHLAVDRTERDTLAAALTDYCTIDWIKTPGTPNINALVPKPKPKPAKKPTGGGSGEGTSSAYYANCDAVRAAGAAPLYAGQPGYETPRLDRDGDGVACE